MYAHCIAVFSDHTLGSNASAVFFEIA